MTFPVDVILGMAVVTFIVGIIRGESSLHMFMAAIALAEGAIPLMGTDISESRQRIFSPL